MPISTSISNPLLFHRSTQLWSSELWKNPSSEYRGAPFWSWNNKLDIDQLLRQLDYMQDKMGMGGVHMHPRTGLDTEYMGEEYMVIMETVIQRCKEKGMLACLYDEDRWPSGAAGGMVSKINPDYRSMHLLVTAYPYGQLPEHLKKKNPAKGETDRTENGKLLAAFDILINESGLCRYRHVQPNDPTTPKDGRRWYFYAEYQPPAPWWNYGTYIDTLNPDALALFLKLTHEKYAKQFGDAFGTTIPSIFTDEPQFTKKEFLDSSDQIKDIFFPWTPNLPDTFKATYNRELIDILPELIWDTGDILGRYQYHNHVSDRFVEAFMDQISDWCRSKGINLTGHMNGEPRLATQTEYIGDAMRCYRNMDLPGIDILCDEREYNTAKQASSVARQNGVRGVLSELYGVTNWTFDFKGHKGQGDWQAALGVTFRVPHLFPASMAGESKRDYPAAIGYQSPWTQEYSYIENHFARVNVALTRGRPVTRVAVIHPIESFWLNWGPADRNGSSQVWREKAHADLTEWLLHGLIDFDFISESLFDEQTALHDINSGVLPVGQCNYEVIIVANLRTIRRTTLERLQRFIAKGGKVIVTGESPALVDAKQDRVDIKAQVVPFTQWDILSALGSHRDVEITSNGLPTKSLMYQLRQDEENQCLFICDTERKEPIETTIRVRGSWDVYVLDTLKGEESTLYSTTEKGWTILTWKFHPCGSLLVKLSPREPGITATVAPKVITFVEQSRMCIKSVSLDEPNVLLLDQAEWRLEGEDSWQPKMEVLRIDNVVRAKLGFPLKKDAFPQPWTASAEDRKPKTTLHLKFGVESDVDVGNVQLAIEDPEHTIVKLDGKMANPKRAGWFTDESIAIIDLGVLSKGSHTLELDIPFGRFSNVERVYILGDFGVQLYGDHGYICSLDRTRLTWGDITRQGLPFYVGNITYHATFDVSKTSPIQIEGYQFEGPALTVTFQNKQYNISLPPHIADLGTLEAGTYDVQLKLFGNRENAFGALHMPPGITNWWGPNAWRTEQDCWMDEYDVKKMGISIAPVVKAPGVAGYSVPMRRKH